MCFIVTYYISSIMSTQFSIFNFFHVVIKQFGTEVMYFLKRFCYHLHVNAVYLFQTDTLKHM